MKALFPIIVLIVFSVGVLSILAVYTFNMGMLLKTSIWLSGLFNILLSIFAISSVSFIKVENPKDEEE